MRKLGIALPAVLALGALLGSPASADVPVGVATHAVAINHTTGLAYVGADCTCGGSLVVIDTATDTVVTTITTASTPTQIAVDEERNQIFAAHFATGTVSVIDGETNAVSDTLPLGGPGLAVNPVRDLLYATLGTGGMAVYDLTTLAHDRTVPAAPVFANWWGVAVNPVTDRIYVENLFGAVEVLDGETYALLADINIFGEARLGVTVDVGANLVYVPRYVSNGRVHVIDGATNPPTLRSDFAAAGSFPRALALDAAAERLYSADLGSGTVTVFSTAGTLTRLETISVGGQPTGIALTTFGPKRLYVTNSVLGSVTVIPLSVNTPPTVISATIAPTSPDTNDTLTATVVARDPDGDPLTYSYQWTKNGTDIAGAITATLDLAGNGNGDRGDAIAVRVTANDGTANSDPLTSAAVTVLNSAPVMVAATIAPQSPDTDDVLTATAVAQDKDLEPITYSYQWTRNGADISGATGATLDLAVSGNGDRGDAIAVRVTASDGTATSDPLTSAAVTVVNGAPVVISATIAPTSPDTDDVLTATVVAQDVDGDALTYSYQWTKNGAAIVGATSDTLDLAVTGDHGDVIAVRVAANDGSADSAPLTSASVTVINSAPAMISATIAPAAPDTDDVLTATVAAQDLDSDALTYSYEWTKNGAVIAGAIGASLDLAVSGNGDHGDEIAVRVTANDGSADSAPLTSASARVINSAPSMISATITPTSPDTDDVLTATAVALDLDGDALTYMYQWTKNGTDILGATNATLDLAVSGNGDSSDAIAVRVTADDGSAISGPLTSASVTVTHNSAPIVVSATIAPTSPDTDDVLIATGVAQDPDGDPLTYSYQWTRNGTDIAGATDATLDLAVSGNGDRGDAIAVRVTASDGSAVSDPLASASVTVVNSAPFASVTLDVIKPSHKDVVTAAVAVTDADLDTVTLTFVWRVEGVVRRMVTTTATSDKFDLSDPRNGSPHDTIVLTVTPNDGVTDGAAVTATAIVLPGN